VFAPHALFGALAVVDVRPRRVPAHKPSLGIVHRTKTNEKPPVLAVMAPPSLLVLEGRAADQRLPALVAEPDFVLFVTKIRGQNLVRRNSRVLNQRPVRIQG